LQAITGAHTLTCLLSRNRSRRNRDAPICFGTFALAENAQVRAGPTGSCCFLYSTPNPGFKRSAAIGQAADHSARNDFIGSIEAARRAGMKQEMNATALRNIETAAKVRGSPGLIP